MLRSADIIAAGLYRSESIPLSGISPAFLDFIPHLLYYGNIKDL